MKYKVLILGPIGDIGGRELETGFIARALCNDESEVNIVSTINFTGKSQLFDFVSRNNAMHLNQIIYNRSLWFRCLTWLAYIKSKKKKPRLSYVSNALAKKTGYHTYAVNTLKDFVEKSDVVIFCAQVSSAYVKEITDYASVLGIPTVMRTSSTIPSISANEKIWLEKITLFIHHSESNASRLGELSNHNYTIIDQCTFKEKQMLQIKPTTKCDTLLYIGRLSKEKGILELVNHYKDLKIPLQLKIIGDGPLFNEISDIIKTLPHIHLLGYQSQDNIVDFIKGTDAIIIPSHEESGPLVALEAMASARLVVSTKVGAMPYRLKGATNQFWFDINDANTLTDVLNKIKELTPDEVKNIAQQNREVYLSNYAQSIIESQYKKTIFSLAKT
ncbi:glycosyltransferase family 4 protein [Winogradskyella sp.]|uniref:glycosyltransferase family 4 protein n=1 Tax=Winogradskyella sp. TaxID=1883156 RepID=UPI002614B223|nr:glycosyltransferase family 4 protein [Winogradskyella sp.]